MVPRISSFHGISIYMYFADHEPPHFHAVHGELSARFEIATLRPMDETLPPTVRRRIQEWGLRHREELRDNWRRARASLLLATIDPQP